MKRCRQVALVLGSMVFSGGLALGQAKLGPHVVDSNGQRIGYFAGWLYNGHHEAVVFIDGVAYLIETARDGFLAPDPNQYIYFEQADCSGQEVIRVTPGTTLLQRAWVTTDGFFHYPSTTFLTGVPSNSYRTLNGDGSLGPCIPGMGESANAAVHLSAPAPTWTPPFLVVEAFPLSPPPAQATFNDVPTNHPFFQFIEALVASGITAGCGSGNYCPDKPVTRGQMAVFLAKALGL